MRTEDLDQLKQRVDSGELDCSERTRIYVDLFNSGRACVDDIRMIEDLAPLNTPASTAMYKNFMTDGA